MSADEQYEAQNNIPTGDAPAGDASDNDYVSRTGQSHIPVQADDKPVDDPVPADGSADSDEYLERDEREAIDESNIVDGRTRGAAKQAGGYREPGDDEVRT
ncbi:MAG: hypothetical protein INR71_07585 [Terriglobus roseus]|nr:hypothetical protein [Terriglobus roseus]